MNILFMTLVDFDTIQTHNIYTDLLRKFHEKGHNVYIISPVERRYQKPTKYYQLEDRIGLLKLKIGNVQKTNFIEKGISTVTLEAKFIAGIKKYFSDIKFDLVLYSTPPITLQKAVNYVKQRDKATTYLMLKDIFPQNAVDIGILTKKGIKGALYQYFRWKEKKLYEEADYIGCMSQANVDYIIKNNPYLSKEKVEVCPNAIEIIKNNDIVAEDNMAAIRDKLGISPDKVLFVYGGNLGKPQGIDFLMSCLKAVKTEEQAYFLIIGSGTEYPKLEHFFKEEKLANAKLLKEFPKKEYEAMLESTDVGLIFLDKRFTIPNFPSRLLSYLEAGIPVLAATDKNTDIGTIIVENEFGFWCESRNVDEFVTGVRKFLKDTKLRKEMGIRGRKFLEENWTSEQDYEIIMKHFE